MQAAGGGLVYRRERRVHESSIDRRYG
jgi:hypothetical protein